MEEHLKNVYGFNNFRSHQKDIIQDLLNKENVFAILPTGGGKSLLYQFPATFTDKITIVISPLISLMNDQCKYLNSNDIKAVCLNSESSVGVSQYTDYKIIYTTPEFIITRIPVFKRIIDKIGLFAVDEAHCVSQWSHDFRPSYQKLCIISKMFPAVPLLAVTATATPRVLDEMYEFLNITEACEYSLGTRRTNLAITVLPKSDFESCVFVEPTIIYVQTRKLCESLCTKFKDRGISCACYHGGMKKEDKEESHELFINGEVIIIVATISFGMGIDKSDIRHVINYGPPANIESYYQEIGRAGRDGIDSKATIYYDDCDFTTTAYLISLSQDEEQIKIKTAGMAVFRSYLQEGDMCRQQMIDHYFATGNFARPDDIIDIPKCKMCDNCTNTNKIPLTDISKEADIIVSILKKRARQRSYDLGLKKTVSLIRENREFVSCGKSVKQTGAIIENLITKDILMRYKAGYGFAIGIGKTNLTKATPISMRMDESVNKISLSMCMPGASIAQLMELRDRLAKKHCIVPTSFINDRVIMNINDKSPKDTSGFWAVDGISIEFCVSSRGQEFIREYMKLRTSSKSSNIDPTKKTKKTREKVLDLYKSGETMSGMAKILGIKERTIIEHVLYIFEHADDVDIDMDYFNLTEEIEERVKKSIAKVGSEYLRTIREDVGEDVTYAQIKLCILVMKVEE